VFNVFLVFLVYDLFGLLNKVWLFQKGKKYLILWCNLEELFFKYNADGQRRREFGLQATREEMV